MDRFLFGFLFCVVVEVSSSSSSASLLLETVVRLLVLFVVVVVVVVAAARDPYHHHHHHHLAYGHADFVSVVVSCYLTCEHSLCPIESDLELRMIQAIEQVQLLFPLILLVASFHPSLLLPSAAAGRNYYLSGPWCLYCSRPMSNQTISSLASWAFEVVR